MGPTLHQKEVIESINGIYVVDAGPGTGKTYSITNRYLKILEKSNAATKDILLLTFTNNAAENMKKKIVNALLNKDPTFNILDTNISTFHSFCNSVLKVDPTNIPSYLGLDMSLTRNFTIIQDNIIERTIFSRAYAKMKEDKTEKYKDLHTIMEGNVFSVHSIIKKLFSKGILPTTDGWLFDGYDMLIGDKEKFIDKAMLLNEPIPGVRGPIQSVLRKSFNTNLSDKTFFDAPDALYIGKNIDPSFLEIAFDENRELLFSFIHDVALEFVYGCIREGQLTFDLLVAFSFLQLLHDDDLKNTLSFEYVMIDEFQDTNELQLMLVMLLMKKPNLCVVGDWKQGIYGFRNATIENILQFEKKITEIVDKLNKDKKRIHFDIKSTKKEFVDNFRSSQDVIDFSYKSLFIPAKKDEKIDIDAINNDITPLISNMEYGNDTSIRFCIAQSKENEIDMITRTLQKIVASQDFMIHDKNSSRTPTFGDIAVLTRTREFGLDLQNVARKRGIPINFDAGVELFSSDEGSILLSWLRVIANFNDKRGWAGIIEAEGIGPIQKRKIIRQLDIPENLIDQRNALLSSSRSIVLLVSKIYSYYAMDTPFTRSILDTVSGLFSSYPLSLEGLIAYIEDSIKNNDTYEMDINTAHDSVSIQTIHGAKGLEYPIVIVANCNDKLFPSLQSDNGVMFFDDILGLRCTKIAGKIGQYQDIFDNWKTYLVRNVLRKSYDEERRLLFVALSRAKQHIIISSWNPSVFFKELSEGRDIYNTSSQLCLTPCFEIDKYHPIAQLPAYESYPKGVPLHEIMGETKYGGGKGSHFGTIIHNLAQDMALGYDVDMKTDEAKNIKSLLSNLGDATILSEVPCTYPFNKCTIKGVIDLLALYKDKFVVIDYKTDTDINANYESYEIQLSLYYHAIKEYYGFEGEAKIAYVSIGEVKDIVPLSLCKLESLVDDYVSKNQGV